MDSLGHALGYFGKHMLSSYENLHRTFSKTYLEISNGNGGQALSLHLSKAILKRKKQNYVGKKLV
jgi:hypothetical protein